MPDRLLETVRALRVAGPDLGVKPLLAKLREQQPDLGAGTREVREALTALKAESEATAAAAAQPADEGDAPPHAVLSLACIGCFRLPSDMNDEREKHPICDMCRDEKLPTTYLCGEDCPANPGAWELHGVFHKQLRKQRKLVDDGGARQQVNRERAEEAARDAARTGDRHSELVAKGMRYASKEDWRRAARANREAIALGPEEPVAYFNLGNALASSGQRGGRAATSRPKSATRRVRSTGHWPWHRPSACCGKKTAARWPSRSGGTTRGSRRCR